MSDQTPEAIEPADVADAAEVAAASASESTTPPVRPRTSRVAVALVTLVVVVVGIALAYTANERWGRHAMVATALSGVEAIITGDGDRLVVLASDNMKKDLTPAVVSKMKDAGFSALFGAPVWTGDSAAVSASTKAGNGGMIVGPTADGKDVVVFRTMGALGQTVGVLSLERSWSGWAITGLTAGKSTETSAPISVTPTSSAPATPVAP